MLRCEEERTLLEHHVRGRDAGMAFEFPPHILLLIFSNQVRHVWDGAPGWDVAHTLSKSSMARSHAAGSASSGCIPSAAPDRPQAKDARGDARPSSTIAP